MGLSDTHHNLPFLSSHTPELKLSVFTYTLASSGKEICTAVQCACPPVSPTHAPQQFWDQLIKTELLQQEGQVVRGEILLLLRAIFAKQYGGDRSPLASVALTVSPSSSKSCSWG